MDQQIRVPSGLNVLLSLWLIASPFVLSFAGSTGMWIAVVAGVVALVLAWLCWNNPASAPILSWFIVLLGVSLILLPFLLSMSGVTALLWDYLIVGIGFVVFGAWSALGTRAMMS
jgi:SPW repeat